MTKAKCPKCKESIDHLNAWKEERGIVRYEFDGVGYTEVARGPKSEMGMHFYCPACGAVLATTEEAANKILEPR